MIERNIELNKEYQVVDRLKLKPPFMFKYCNFHIRSKRNLIDYTGNSRSGKIHGRMVLRNAEELVFKQNY